VRREAGVRTACRDFESVGIKSLLWGFLSHKTQKSLRFLVNPASFFRRNRFQKFLL
jgi:hypothetical protein